jgi:hypothetical protein
MVQDELSVLHVLWPVGTQHQFTSIGKLQLFFQLNPSLVSTRLAQETGAKGALMLVFGELALAAWTVDGA